MDAQLRINHKYGKTSDSRRRRILKWCYAAERPKMSKPQFPSNFYWGYATASAQVEGSVGPPDTELMRFAPMERSSPYGTRSAQTPRTRRMGAQPR